MSLPPFLVTKLLKPYNFLSVKSTRTIFCSNIWFLLLVPDTQLSCYFGISWVIGACFVLMKQL